MSSSSCIFRLSLRLFGLAFLLSTLPAVFSLRTNAQPLTADTPAAAVAALDTAQSRTLRLEVEGMAFFHDNEFDGTISKGYSLPGFRVQPRLVYQPLPHLRLEGGFHAQIYEGAGKYPNYAFHDIATWKGTQWQEGAHLLPILRATARLSRSATLVLGQVYGSTHHDLSLPLYNPELALSADPEMGAQLLVDTRRWQMDAWVDWQSFIFEQDTHQEAFTVGMTHRLWLTPRAHRSFTLSLPARLLVQHRGGEQDLPSLNLGVQTLSNASLGLAARWERPSGALRALDAEASALVSYQQAGRLWPWTSGGAGWLSLTADWHSGWRTQLGLLYAHRFVSLYGAPFFGALSLKEKGGRFSYMGTGYVGAEYARSLGAGYSWGAHVYLYLTRQGRLTFPDARPAQAERWGNAFSFGLFLRFRPSFLLKRW